MARFSAYHGVDAATHQARVDELSSSGFRPVALNVSGTPGNARYAAVWVQRPGPEWVAVHGPSATEYQARLAWETAAFALVGVSSALPAGTASTPGMAAITVEQRWTGTSWGRWGSGHTVLNAHDAQL